MSVRPDNNWIPEPEGIEMPANRDLNSLVSLLPESTLLPDQPLPFEHTFVPWLLSLHRQLTDNCTAYTLYCTEATRGSMLRAVLLNLQEYIGLALQSDLTSQAPDWFLKFLIPRSNGRADKGKEQPPLDTRYRKYVNRIISNRWSDFLNRFPVAKRIITTVLLDRFSYYTDFLNHFVSDQARVADFLGCKGKAPVITAMKFGLSDPHQGGRTVINLTLEGGATCFYKPRSFSVDRAWEQILAWMGRKMDLFFLTPDGLGGNDYCWVQNLENTSLDHPEDGALYYRRAGAILGLVYVLGGTDFHQENLIACKDHPVLIDVETLLRPLVRPFHYDTLDGEQKKRFLSLGGDSVMRTCLLPMWTPVGKDLFHDYGALTPADELEFARYQWTDINTDRMERIRVPGKNNLLANIPHHCGRPILVTDHMDALLDGFSTAYRILLKNRRHLASPDSDWNALKTSTFRVLPRNTQIYANMSKRLSSAFLLQDPPAFDTELEKLSRPFRQGVPEKRQKALERVAKLERDSLERHDIPVIHSRPTDLAIRLGERVILDDFFLVDGWNEFLRRLDKLDEKDLEYQSGLIQASLSMRYPDVHVETINPARSRSWQDAPPCSDQGFMDAASAISHEIADRAMEQNGKHLWLSRKFDPMTHFLTIGPTDNGLYEGSAGIGLFFAAWEKMTGDKRYHDLAVNCFQPLFELKEEMERQKEKLPLSLGFGTGLGGLAWALDQAGGMLRENSLSKLALQLLHGINTQSMEGDTGMDIMSGSAGTILTLLHSVGEEKKSDTGKEPSGKPDEIRERALALAVKCGEQLLSQRVSFEKRALWMSTYAPQPLTGYAHGAAGYAYALLKLYHATGDERFKNAAMAAIEYERSVYVPKAKNWPDFRVHREIPKGETAFMGGWCAGAPGIGMARLLTLDTLDSPQIREEIENALTFTKAHLFLPDAPDHYCCGNSGRVDFLLQAGLRLNRPELCALARAGGSYMIHRAGDLGRYTFNGDINGPVFSPGLYTGLAGVGWTLMRLASSGTHGSLMGPGT